MRRNQTRLKYFAKSVLSLLIVCCLGNLCDLPDSTCGAAWAAAGSGVSVQTVVEKDSISVGESLLMQIRVAGGEIAPGTDPPDTSGIADATVEYLGGQSNNSSSVTIINGKMTKVESYGYVYSYRLTPKKAGRLEIPAIPVPADAAKTKILKTQPITVKVTEPEVTDDFQLELRFSKTSFYVGEPVSLTVVWYIGKDVESANFNLPVLQDPAFIVAEPKSSQDPKKQYLQIQVGATNVVAEKGTAIRNGREYMTLSFRKVLFARQPGSIEIPEATVSCRALVGYSRQQRARGPFDPFFNDDLFSAGRRGVYKVFVARSAPTAMTISALPEVDKPANFSGAVGHFQVETSANPTEVSIGDPITLSVVISGADYLENVELPPLAKDPEFENNFKIPEEMAAGVIRGETKQFSQTLRAKNTDVKAIPTVKLPYFNPDSGRYEVARSQPIALHVKPTKILTSADVEGKPGDTAVKKSELENWSQGIAYNYEGPEVLEKQAYMVSSLIRSPLWLAITFIPLLAFISLLLFTGVRQKRLANPERLRSRKALARFKQRVRALTGENSRHDHVCAVLLEAVRDYLGDKLNRAGATLTFTDVEQELQDKGTSPELAEQLRHLFDACEMGSYGGMDAGKPIDQLARKALDVIGSLDRIL